MTSQVTQTDLLNAASSIFAISFAFDLIITECLALLKKRDVAYLQNSSATKYRFNPNALKISRLMKNSKDWGFYLPGKQRAKERDANVDSLYLRAQQYAQQHSLAVVQFAPNSLPTRWHIGA
ncbi:MAG: hypothetical protein VB032_00900 [Burkholderiaceae bacterium]|nr:hypothetical protein [Burkholderiaceae bacterium]